MRLRLVAISLIAALLGSLLVTMSPAQAAGCVTVREYKRVHQGMTKLRVHRIFGTKGTLLFRNPGTVTNMAREYRACPGFVARRGDRTIQIQYNNYATNGGPMRVVYKQSY